MRSISSALAALALTVAMPAWGAVISIDVSDAQSVDFFGDADNNVMVIDLNALLGTSGPVTVDGIGWDVSIETVGGSWLSEARISLQDSAGNGFIDLIPGIDDTAPGIGNYSSGGLVDLVGAGLAFTLSDGVLVLEFFESFDDFAGAVDATWSGSLQISAVPLPAGLWLLASALGVLLTRRRVRG